jgi:hypothetical protein
MPDDADAKNHSIKPRAKNEVGTTSTRDPTTAQDACSCCFYLPKKSFHRILPRVELVFDCLFLSKINYSTLYQVNFATMSVHSNNSITLDELNCIMNLQRQEAFDDSTEAYGNNSRKSEENKEENADAQNHCGSGK